MADNDHKPGSMDIKEQEKTFAAFINATVWVIGVVIVALILLYLING
ncbi:MAG: aa3-type cytochrome c oxidase subunit IV [Shimia sp.]